MEQQTALPIDVPTVPKTPKRRFLDASKAFVPIVKAGSYRFDLTGCTCEHCTQLAVAWRELLSAYEAL